MKRFVKNITVATAVLLSFSSVYGKQPANDIVKEITPYVTNYVKTPAPMVFLDDKTYAQLSDDARTVDVYEISSGKKVETLFDVANTREAQISRIEGFVLSNDRKKLIVWNESTPIYRRSVAAAYYVYDTHSRILRPVSTRFAKTRCPMFSPDGRMIAFVAENNIYLKKLDYNTEVAVTTDGVKDEIINGATDWTYEEEFSVTSLMAFTDDNTNLCFVKTNESQVPTYTLPVYGGACEPQTQYELYPGMMKYKYPVAGETNSTVTLHVYEISNRKILDVKFEDKTIEYIPRIDAIAGSDQILVTTLNRDQNRMEIYNVNPKTTIVKSVFQEKSQAWIIPEMYEKLKVTADGFFVMSPRSGFTHLYQYALNGTLTRTLTQGDYDVTDFYGIDSNGSAYYQAALPSPIDRTVCSSDVKGNRKSLSDDKGGFASADFSSDMKHAVMKYSNILTPPIYSLVTSTGKQVRGLVDNADVKTRYASLPVKEFVKVQGESGITFNAYLVKPTDFDASRKYPVVVYQYSGPGSQSVLNQWSVTWENYFASKGYVVFCLDGRGTGGRGTEFMFPVYKKLGYYETVDQLAGAEWLKTQTWVDRDRIGIHGWSYGGYETLMCLQADRTPFAAGVAIAPVTDWRFYDSVYSERYMLTPQQNFDGYKTSAPLNFTDKMNSQLLLMLGTADDNVHPANTYEYISALQVEGKLFDMMVFPNKNHSIYGCNARAVVFGNMFRFFNNFFAK